MTTIRDYVIFLRAFFCLHFSRFMVLVSCSGGLRSCLNTYWRHDGSHCRGAWRQWNWSRVECRECGIWPCPPSDPVSTSAAAMTEVAEVTSCHGVCACEHDSCGNEVFLACPTCLHFLCYDHQGRVYGGGRPPLRRCSLRKNVTKIWKRKMHERVLWSIFKPWLIHANAKAQLHSGWCPAKLKWFHSITASSSLTNNANVQHW